ncbi:hypothetical protein DLAC_01827 [Tieghemostelium lacteum]|uniref:GPI inositol-deacylase n=1 Tax=Tieghemostelium lacteum TaxID=361077 RepID=A0A152A6G2_TIELA|nr:hypothetical protein DLAC_01827 [Tieghemostelium lacteum]|eukprot:KYR01814.1 hypothetical protein DLAC_01827 [Tieghemostelium lacteum]
MEKCLIILFNVITVVIGLISIKVMFVDIEPNTCTMTYMVPNYYNIPTNHSRYNLYYYKEGKSTQYSNQNQLLFSKLNRPLRGIPILFIPGNSGSYKQARSIAAEAFMHVNKDIPNPFDVENPNRKKRKQNDYGNELDMFTVDFEEELSAFGGDLMYSETEYVNECIKVILNLYQTNSDLEYKPTSIILVAHSMGGVVARMSVLLPNHQYGSVTTIITLNTSHRNAPIYSHLTTTQFYKELNSHWSQYIQPKHLTINQTTGEPIYLPPIYNDICVISIAGGHRDTLIRSELVSLDGLVDSDKSFSVITTSIPEVLMETDHQCILWCNEVVLSIVEGLLSLSHPITKQNTYSVHERLYIIKKVLHSNVPELLGHTLSSTSSTINTDPSTTIHLYSNTKSSNSKSDISTLIEIAKNTTFEKVALTSIIHKPALSYRGNNAYTRITVSSSPVNLFHFHFRVSDWWSDSTYFSMLTSLPLSDYSIIAFKDSELKEYTELDQPTQQIQFPPLPPLIQSSIESPCTLTILNSEQLSRYHSVFISFPRQARKQRFVSVFQFYNSTTSRIQIPRYPLFGEYSFNLPSGHPMITNFTLPSYTIGYPLRVSLKQNQQFYFQGDLHDIDDSLPSTSTSTAFDREIHSSSSSSNSGANGNQHLIYNNLSPTSIRESNIYSTFLPSSYHYIPQSMEEGKFLVNSTTINIKFHQSTRKQLSHSGYTYQQQQKNTMQLQENYSDRSFFQKLLMINSDTNTKSTLPQDDQINLPHLYMILDPFTSYEISISFDWVGSIGTLFFHYIFSLIPCTFALFLYIFSCQMDIMIKKDEFPDLISTLKCEISRLSIIFILIPLSISILFKLINSRIPIFYGEYFPDPFITKTMTEIIPPFWTIPFLFIFSTCILTILITIKSIIYMIGVLISKLIIAPTVNIKSIASRFNSVSKWIIVGFFILVTLHSAIGLIMFLLYLAFSPSFNYVLLMNSNSTSPTLNSMNSNSINSSNMTNNNTKLGSKNSIKLSSYKSNYQTFRDVLNYQKSIFLLYLFSTIIMVPKMIVWFKHLAFEWRIFDSYELFILFACTHICLSKIELSHQSLQTIKYLLLSSSILSSIYSIILIYRMLYFIQLLSFTFILCHIWSKLKDKSN